MLQYINFKARILLGFLAIISLMTVISASSLINLSNTKRDLSEINETLLPNALLMGQMARDIVLVHQFLADVSASHAPQGYKDAEKSAQDFKQGLLQFRRHFIGNAEKTKELDILEANFDRFYEDGKLMAAAYVNEGLDAGNAAMQEFDHQSYNLTSQIIKLRNTEINAAKQRVTQSTETTTQAASILWTMSLVIFTLALGIALFLTRHLSKQIGIDPLYAKGITKEIAAGDLSRSIHLDPDDKDSLLHAIKNMQQKLLIRRTAEHKAAEEIMRLKLALDSICTGVMITDNERNIIYVNSSVLNILGKTEADIQQQLPGFSIADMVGTNIDALHKNPMHQAGLLSCLTETYKTDLLLGDRSMVMTANPIINDQGQRLGTVAEWLDRTDEVVVEQELSAFVASASKGDFSKRFDLHGKEGFLRELGAGLNRLLDAGETGLNDVARVLDALSHCDLTETISDDYDGTFGQLKDNANTTVAILKNIIHQIKEATDCVSTGATEIASGNNDLAQRTEEQASSLQQTVASMEQLTSSVQHNTENAKQTNLLAIGAAEIANQGGAMVGQVVATMSDIKDSSLKIENIIAVIDDIAFQTNILAINAAIEAARAGMHGQGFAVVADEVRNLAQRAAASAGEIKILIEEAVKKIDNGSVLAGRAGFTMEEILKSIQGVTGMMAEITAASVEQSTGIEQINLAINQMDYVTQQNAALVEQASAAAESLEEQAKNLAVTVNDFKIDDTSADRDAFYTFDDSAEIMPELHSSRQNHEHKEQTIWNAIKTTGSNALHNLESAAAAKLKPQIPPLLAIANGDWEEF
ncbi:MAG: methyl-accepting chemotaxis protein [Methylobacter sp.]